MDKNCIKIMNKLYLINRKSTGDLMCAYIDSINAQS